MDIRHPLKEFDNAMLDWARDAKMPIHILLTKSDKLKRGPAQSTLLKVKNALKDLGGLATVQTFSSLNSDGQKILEQTLTRWFEAPFIAENEQDLGSEAED